MEPSSGAKNRIRREVYAKLHAAKAARFPFPIEGRIPNFVGAEAAARQLRSLPVYQKAQTIKANPDAPQLPVRAMALADGKTLYMPSPRLKGGFLRIHPDDVPTGEERKAASLSHCHKYGTDVTIEDLAQQASRGMTIDLIVTGSVAVTRDGARAGKGEGYADLEYALLQELGFPHMPVIGTVHPAQIVDHLPVDRHDLSLDYIITPDEIIETQTPFSKPTGVQWDLLSPEDLKEMPILEEVRRLAWQSLQVPDIVGPGLRVLFVGINPGKKSALTGHNFAGPGNHFWRLLFESGLTSQLFTPEQERNLLKESLGITNIVSRASRGEADLTWEELLEGATVLRQKIANLRPKVAAFLGKNVYRAYAGLGRSAAVSWGLQSSRAIPEVKEFVAPNPSARSTIPYQVRLDIFREIHRLA